MNYLEEFGELLSSKRAQSTKVLRQSKKLKEEEQQNKNTGLNKSRHLQI